MQTLALQDCMMEHKDYYKDFIGLADNAEGRKLLLAASAGNVIISAVVKALPVFFTKFNKIIRMCKSHCQEQQVPSAFPAAPKLRRLAFWPSSAGFYKLICPN